MATTTTATDRFSLLKSESDRIGWPLAYESDLEHDRRFLELNPNEPMVWILRPMGTHLYQCNAESSGEARYCRTVIEYHSGNHKLNTHNPNDPELPKFYLLTRDKLQQVSPAEAASAIRFIE